MTTSSYATRSYALDMRDQNIVCRQWAHAHGYYGAQGGWIYRVNGPAVCQGWASFYHRHKREILNWLCQTETAFPDWDYLVNKTASTYRPTIFRKNARCRWLADSYDQTMRARGDARRAYPEVTYS